MCITATVHPEMRSRGRSWRREYPSLMPGNGNRDLRHFEHSNSPILFVNLPRTLEWKHND